MSGRCLILMLMTNTIFYRNARARGLLELFLLSAISSLLLVRFYLAATGYPQIGGGGLHIAHMLWGGFLMLGALVCVLSFLGARILRVSAVLGGAGFGVFIDELGKFITRNNDYFYRPTVGIIYAIFICLYLVFNFLSRKQPLTSREYQLNALAQLEEAVERDLDPTEEAAVRSLLSRADPLDPITQKLQRLLDSIETIPAPPPGNIARFLRWLHQGYERFWCRRGSDTFVRIFFVGETTIFVGGVLFLIYNDLDNILDLFTTDLSFSMELAIGQLAASLVAASFAIWGAVLLARSRLRAYEQFRRATLVNIFLTQFFAFMRIEFGALPGFFFNLILLGLITYAIRQEVRLTKTL